MLTSLFSIGSFSLYFLYPSQVDHQITPWNKTNSKHTNLELVIYFVLEVIIIFLATSQQEHHDSIFRREFREVLLNFCASPLKTSTIKSRIWRVCTINSTSVSVSTTILNRCWSFLYSSTYKSPKHFAFLVNIN